MARLGVFVLLCLFAILCDHSSRAELSDDEIELEQELVRELKELVTEKRRSQMRARFNVGALVKAIQKTDWSSEKERKSFGDKLLSSLNIKKEQTAQAQRMFGAADKALELDPDQEKIATLVVSKTTIRDDFVQPEMQRSAAFAAELAADEFKQKTQQDPSALNAEMIPETMELSALTGDVPCPFTEARTTPCDADSLYREPNARCTNLKRPTDGMTSTAFHRVLPPNYEDDVKEFRKTGFASGSPLESPRKISTTMTTTNVVLDQTGTSAFAMQWGQFIAHEYTQISTERVTCCADQVFQADNPDKTPTPKQLESIQNDISASRGDECIAISIPDDDPVYKDRTCMQQSRSIPTVVDECTPGPRQQSNTATAPIDASAVYGSDSATMDQLRSKQDGKLRVQDGSDGDLPPAAEGCPAAQQGKSCPFKAGDGRINTTPQLAAVHTIFLRKHNQICDELKALNPKWDDERLFQEARRIVAAIEQQIHFNEWLQIVLSDEIRTQYDLQPTRSGFFQKSDFSLSTQILHECATAACRFGHSMISEFFTLADRFQGPLVDFFFKSEPVYDDGAGACLMGLIKDRPWITDINYPESMRDKMFNRFDIAAFNLNRGRDHGLRSYVDYREHYGMSVPRSFDDLEKTHPKDIVDRLKKSYKEVGDIELYIGGMFENLESGSLVGLTFNHIIADQFRNIKKGDRFYYESPSAKFSIEQVNAIRGYTLAELMCDTLELDSIEPNVFKRRADGNQAQQCNKGKSLSLAAWKEKEEVKTTPAPPVCEWEVVSESKCCDNQRTITRKCVKKGNCQCKGPRTIMKPCRCTRSWLCKLECTGSNWVNNFNIEWVTKGPWSVKKLKDTLTDLREKIHQKWGHWKTSISW